VIGFVAAFGCVLCKTIFAVPAADSADQRTDYNSFRVLAGAGLVSIVVALLVFRPILMADKLDESFMVVVSVVLTLYVIVAISFGIAFLFLWLSEEKSRLTKRGLDSATRAAIFCGVVAVLIHNLIDFAIFEPGVLTCFWTMIACLVAVDFKAGRYRSFVLRPSGTVRVAAIATAVVIVWGYCNYALVPAVKASATIQKALQNPNRAGQLFAAAAAEDKLSPRALNLNGRLHLQYYRYSRDKQSMLTQAAQYFDAAFKNYEKLMIAYELLATVSPADEAGEWNQKAYDSGIETALRYPGKGRLQFELGKIAERLDDNKAALAHYKKALQIEDGYRAQFRRMYPGREMFSRLGQKNYASAKERIDQLGK
jgi:hypothetical protein